MTPLEQAKVDFTDALIALELAQSKFNEAKKKLVEKMQQQP